MNIGDQLHSLQQGYHISHGSGTYEGGGVYKIEMKDGGNGNYFWMRFRLTSNGGGKYTLTRLDCGDPPTVLEDKGGGALVGGLYTLNF